MITVPNFGPYARPEVPEINWNDIPSAKSAHDSSAILMVAEDERGNSLGTYAIYNPEKTIPAYLGFIGKSIVDRFDLEGSIQLVVRW